MEIQRRCINPCKLRLVRSHGQSVLFMEERLVFVFQLNCIHVPSLQVTVKGQQSRRQYCPWRPGLQSTAPSTPSGSTRRNFSPLTWGESCCRDLSTLTQPWHRCFVTTTDLKWVLLGSVHIDTTLASLRRHHHYLEVSFVAGISQHWQLPSYRCIVTTIDLRWVLVQGAVHIDTTIVS